jgi:hypothetical protein
VLARIHSTPPGGCPWARSRRASSIARPAGGCAPRRGADWSVFSLAGGPRHPGCAVVDRSRRCCSRPGVGIGMHGVVTRREVVAMPQSLRRAKPPFPMANRKTGESRFAEKCASGSAFDFAYAQRLRAFLPREGFPHACTPKTVSSTRRQYASMTFVLSADSPRVICISGPNLESVAVRLTII